MERSSRSVRTWKSSSAAAVELQVAQFVDEQQVHTAVAGDEFGEVFVVGGFDEFVDQLAGQGVADSVAGFSDAGAQTDEQVAFAGAGVPDQAERGSRPDPVAAGELTDEGRVDGGVGLKEKSSKRFGRGTRRHGCAAPARR